MLIVCSKTQRIHSTSMQSHHKLVQHPVDRLNSCLFFRHTHKLSSALKSYKLSSGNKATIIDTMVLLIVPQLDKESFKIPWSRCNAVINAMVPMIQMLINNYKTPCDAMCTVHWLIDWVALVLNWDRIWCNVHLCSVITILINHQL